MQYIVTLSDDTDANGDDNDDDDDDNDDDDDHLVLGVVERWRSHPGRPKFPPTGVSSTLLINYQW